MPRELDSFVSLLRRHDRGLRALAFRLLGDRDRMDDTLQDAYLRAYRGFSGFRGEAAVGTWLYRIVYNACVDELRGDQGRVSVSLEEMTLEPSVDRDPGELAQQRVDLEAALAALAVQDRAAVLLVDAEGFTYREAAEVLGVPAGTVASRLARARGSLRTVLEMASERENQ